MANLLKKQGKEVAFVGLKEQEQIVSAALISSISVKIGYCFDISGGPLLSYDNEQLVQRFFHSLKQYIKNKRGVYLSISPKPTYYYCDSERQFLIKDKEAIYESLITCGFQHSGFNHAYINGSPCIVYVKDLTDITAKNLMKTYPASTRNKVNKTEKSGVKVRRLCREELFLFEDVMVHTAINRQFFHDKGLAYYEQLYDSFGEQVYFMVAEIDFQKKL